MVDCRATEAMLEKPWFIGASHRGNRPRHKALVGARWHLGNLFHNPRTTRDLKFTWRAVVNQLKNGYAQAVPNGLMSRIIGNHSFGPMFSVKGVSTFRILRDPATDDFSREQNPVQLACDVKIELFIPMLKRLCRVRNQTARIDSQGFELLQSAFKILHGQVHA